MIKKQSVGVTEGKHYPMICDRLSWTEVYFSLLSSRNTKFRHIEETSKVRDAEGAGRWVGEWLGVAGIWVASSHGIPKPRQPLEMPKF